MRIEHTINIDFDIDPIEIHFDGKRTKPPHEYWEETLHLLPAVPHAALSALTSMITIDNRGRARANAAAIDAFFTQSLTDESADRYLTMIKDNDRMVTTNDLADVINRVVEATSDRPTRPSSSSSRTTLNGGTGSTDTSPTDSTATA